MITAAAQAGPSLLDQAAKLGPVATGIAAVVALVVGIATVVQRSRADRRDQWWKRTQWALEQSTSHDDARAAVGFAVLARLGRSKLAGKEEAQMLEAAWVSVLDEISPPTEDGTADQATEEREAP